MRTKTAHLVSHVTKLWIGRPKNRASIQGKEERFISSPNRLGRLWGPPSLQLGGYRRLFSRGYICESGELTNHPYHVKGKVLPVHAMKAIEGEEIKLHQLLTSTLDGDKWLMSSPHSFTPRKPRYPLNMRLVGPPSRSGPYGEEKLFLPLPRIEPQPHVVSKFSLGGAVYSLSNTHLWVA